MKRLLLYPLASVLMLAGEPAVGATLDLPQAPRSLSGGWIAAPIRWLISTLDSADLAPTAPDTAEPSPGADPAD